MFGKIGRASSVPPPRVNIYESAITGVVEAAVRGWDDTGLVRSDPGYVWNWGLLGPLNGSSRIPEVIVQHDSSRPGQVLQPQQVVPQVRSQTPDRISMGDASRRVESVVAPGLASEKLKMARFGND
jgi:hypothetical protein